MELELFISGGLISLNLDGHLLSTPLRMSNLNSEGCELSHENQITEQVKHFFLGQIDKLGRG